MVLPIVLKLNLEAYVVRRIPARMQSLVISLMSICKVGIHAESRWVPLGLQSILSATHSPSSSSMTLESLV